MVGFIYSWISNHLHKKKIQKELEELVPTTVERKGVIIDCEDCPYRKKIRK
jgi:hypothetical protein